MRWTTLPRAVATAAEWLVMARTDHFSGWSAPNN
jgi:hypothetical protein